MKNNRIASYFLFLVFLFVVYSSLWSMNSIYRATPLQLPGYNIGDDSLNSFFMQLKKARDELPLTGNYCFGDGNEERNSYNWLVYSLAPRKIIPTNFGLNKKTLVLDSVAPSLLWESEGNIKCDFYIFFMGDYNRSIDSGEIVYFDSNLNIKILKNE